MASRKQLKSLHKKLQETLQCLDDMLQESSQKSWIVDCSKLSFVFDSGRLETHILENSTFAISNDEQARIPFSKLRIEHDVGVKATVLIGLVPKALDSYTDLRRFAQIFGEVALDGQNTTVVKLDITDSNNELALIELDQQKIPQPEECCNICVTFTTLDCHPDLLKSIKLHFK